MALLAVPTLLIRIWIIRHAPEPDTDFAGHFGIAHALLADPTNVAIHWVWLPAYHFVLALLVLAGVTADGVRILNCALAALVPALVLLYGESGLGSNERGLSREAPWMAAVLCAVSPLVNLLGTSGQQETLFTLLVVGTAWALETGRFKTAGALLATAALVRYEAWGAVGLLVGLRLLGSAPRLMARVPKWLAWLIPSCRFPLVVVVPSLMAMGGWCLARRLGEGSWLGFLHELYRYSHVQHDAIERDWLWFPVKQPLFVFGGMVLGLFLIGLRRAWRPSHVVPVGIHLFLLVAYVSKGALGSARYYESLTPFIALGAAQGVGVIGARWRWVAPAVFALATWQLMTLSAQLYRWTWPSLDEASLVAQDVDGLARSWVRLLSSGSTASFERSAQEHAEHR